jgi:hypothetical protein
MNLKSVLLIGLVCAVIHAQAPAPKVAECLSKISADDGHIGDYAKDKAEVTVANQGNTQVINNKRLLQTTENSTLTVLIDSYFALNAETQAAIKKCNPSNAGAMKRCESVHGAGNCESRGPGLVNKKCEGKLNSFGHSICTERCPSAFEDHGLYCYKKRGYKSKRYDTLEECKKTHKKCERFALSYYVPECKAFHTRQGPDGCIPTCPQHWEDLGRKCLKPTMKVQDTVFAWKNTDN